MVLELCLSLERIMGSWLIWLARVSPSNLLLLGYLICYTRFLAVAAAGGGGATFSITNFGASPSSKDNTEALQKAWDAACTSVAENPTVLVPLGTFKCNVIELNGKLCKHSITIEVQGELLGPLPTEVTGENKDTWITIRQAPDVKLIGPGTINGNGPAWWLASCKTSSSSTCNKRALSAVGIYDCARGSVSNIKLVNAAQMHLFIMGSDYFKVTGVSISSDKNSPNTDGIHVTQSSFVTISDCVIATGDDCISIGDQTFNLTVSGIKCGPGHGISIGSLGKDGTKANVQNVSVDSSTFDGTTNGVRIKTWQGGSGVVQHVKFTNLNFIGAENAIIIDQNYCDGGKTCPAKVGAVQISDVSYFNLRGTGLMPLVNLDCSKAVPCTQITMDKVDITATGVESKSLNKPVVCENARVSNSGSTVNTAACPT